MSQQVCRYYLSGQCKFGDNCKFQHPGATRSNAFSNRFGPLSNLSSGGSSKDMQTFNLDKEVIERDLRHELPQWILSAYGPGKDAPEQLFGGYPREQCPEEIRLYYLKGVESGNAAQAARDIEQLQQEARQQIQAALNNLDGAVQFIASAANKHPNRLDIVRQGCRPGGTTGVFSKDRAQTASSTATTQRGGLFGSPAPQTGSAFGQPSALGQRPNPFATTTSTPAFGQPSQPTSAFGSRPGGFGQPAFGQPAQPATSAFGQPSALGAKPNPFGAPAATTPAFGQPSQLGTAAATGSAFGQASTLGARPNPFGAPSGPSPFGSVAQKPAGSGFGAFAGGATTASPFATAAATASAPANLFAQPAAAPNPFASAVKPSPFGAPAATTTDSMAMSDAPATSTAPVNPFAAAAAAAPTTASPFGAPQPATAAPSPFGQPATATTTAPNPFAAAASASAAPAAKPFAAPSATPASATVIGQGNNPYGPSSTRQHPPPSSYLTADPANPARLAAYRGMPVEYRDGKPGYVVQATTFGGKPVWKRLWNPEGPPGYNADTEPPPAENGAGGERYDEKSKKLWEQWVRDNLSGRPDRAGTRARFHDGLVPEVPPLREWCVWDF